MILDTGVQLLLGVQRAYLATLEWCLFASNLTITGSTTAATLGAAEAAWSGYSRTTVSSYSSPTVSGGVAQTNATGFVTFTNSSGSTVTFYGWFLVDTSSGEAVAALNIGATSIPGGGNYSFAPAVTDQNTGP